MKVKTAISLMCMDLIHFKSQLDFLNKNADFLHIDVMDGHFVPNLTLSPFFVQSVKKVSDLPMDTHLMTTDPTHWAPLMAKAGAKWISPQAETINGKAFCLMDQIRSLGCQTGIVLNPETSLEAIKYYIHLVDKVTIMTVDPGFAGQPFIPAMLRKIEDLREIRSKKNLNFLIEVDGSCNKNTYRQLLKAGADVLVMGSTGLFNMAPDLPTAWDIMVKDIKAAEAEIA